MSPQVLATVKHFLILAGLGALSVVLAPLATLITHIDVTHLPVVVQTVWVLTLPVLASLFAKYEAEVAAELAAEQNASLTAKLADVSAKLAAVPVTKSK
jgi:hypothetical protein